MVTPAYWFPREEYAARVARVQAALAAAEQDALIAFLPETVTWLTGFFTRGYSSFQFAIIPAAGAPVVVCRDVEEYYLDSTCVFPGRFMWRDSDSPDRPVTRWAPTRLRSASAGSWLRL